MKELRCSDSECKRRLTDVKNMSFEELSKYNVKCCNCGDWIFKEQEVANKTYNAVSIRYAEEFMRKMLRN